MASPITFTASGAKAVSGAAPNSLVHAKLELREPPTGGSTANPSSTVLGVIDFQFNPKELSLSKSAKWQRTAQRNASKSGPPEFKGADPAKLSVEMFLDATDKMDDSVVKTVEKLFSCCVPVSKTTGAKGSPPWVIFSWGGLTGFPSFVSSVTAKYTLFTPGGTPVRAVCTVAMEEISGEQGGQNPTSGALAARESHVVVAGDTFSSIAHKMYGNPNLWREIAEANQADDPMRLRPGTRLLIPALEELDGDGRGE
jgi:nucleoid-associated protein YgaU